MATSPRSDILMNLPALEKLETMLLVSLDSHDPGSSKQSISESKYMTEFLSFFLQGILDSFDKREFWYADQRNQSFNESKKSFQRSEDKWWLPEPCVPDSGLSDRMHRELQQKRDQASQIHKMAMEINSSILSEMQVPSSYLETLPKVLCQLHNLIITDSVSKLSFCQEAPFAPPFFFNRSRQVKLLVCTLIEKMKYRKKNSQIQQITTTPTTHLLPFDRCYVTPQSGRVGVGDAIYRYMSTGDQFSPEHLLNFLNLSSEHEALEIADRVEAAMYVWRRKASTTHVVSKWENVTELNADGDKNLVLASRARSLLLCLKQRFPGLSQTTLDTSKIQYNKVMVNIRNMQISGRSMFIYIFLLTRKAHSPRNIQVY